MMVPHWAILPSNRSYCIGNLDKALRHPHQGNDCKRPHLDFENPACQYVFQWALWISFSARTMLRSKGKPRQSITPSAVPWGPSFLLIDIAATWRSGARGEARAALERSFCHCFSLSDLHCVHAMSIFNLGPVLACVCRNLHVATNLYGIWNAWIIHLWKSYAIPLTYHVQCLHGQHPFFTNIPAEKWTVCSHRSRVFRMSGIFMRYDAREVFRSQAHWNGWLVDVGYCCHNETNSDVAQVLPVLEMLNEQLWPLRWWTQVGTCRVQRQLQLPSGA